MSQRRSETSRSGNPLCEVESGVRTGVKWKSSDAYEIGESAG